MTLLGTKCACTTAYHPQTNGMVEHFNLQLKAALRVHHNLATWMDSLPLVLLGIRTAVKGDISSTRAEMVYSTTLRLPGEVFTSSPPSPVIDPVDYVSQLKSHMQLICPTPPRPSQCNGIISNTLASATHVFIRHDAVR